MILVERSINGKKYHEPFSKGILARSLNITNLSFNKAYNLASIIESQLIEEDISVIENSELVSIIINLLEEYDSDVAVRYKSWRNIRKSKKPLIILLGGASGVGTSSIAFELANRLGIKNLISTDMIREVMRKIISKELSPVIHRSSFDAYKSIRLSQEIDPIVEGFIEHVNVVSLGVEAVIERALKEGISIIVEGVHIVPGFINEDLLENYNVMLFTLYVDDKRLHKSRFYSRCRKLWARRPLQLYLDNFESIRKTQNFFIGQALENDSILINNVNVDETLDMIIKNIIKNYGDKNVK